MANINNIKKSGVYFSIGSITGVKPETVKKSFNKRKLDPLRSEDIKTYIGKYNNY